MLTFFGTCYHTAVTGRKPLSSPSLYLQDAGSPVMVWDIEKEPAEGQVVNETVEVRVCLVLCSLNVCNVEKVP